MRSPGRTLLPAIVLSLVALTAAACTSGGGGAPASSTPPTSPTSGPATSNTPVKFKPGEYQYVFGNITASLTMHGSDATMEILNQTAGDIGAPSVYVITGDDQRFDGQVAGAAPIPKAGDVTLNVTFPPQVTEKTVGLMVLVLGSDNMGAFAPVPVTPVPVSSSG